MASRDMPIRPSVEEYLRANYLTTPIKKMCQDLDYAESTLRRLMTRLGLNKVKDRKPAPKRAGRASGVRVGYEDTSQVVESAIASRTALEMVWRAE